MLSRTRLRLPRVTPGVRQSFLSEPRVLVGRSIGLYLTYADFIRSSRKRWHDQPRGKVLGRLSYSFTSWLLRRSADRALAHCDWFNVPNEDEKRELERSRPGAKIIVQP